MSHKVIILGGVGNGTVIAQAILDANRRGDDALEVAGYFNDRLPIGTDIEGYPVLAEVSRKNVIKYSSMGYKFIYTIYRIDGNVERLQLFDDLGFNDQNLATFIHPTAYVAPDVKIAPGVVVMPYAMISSAAILGVANIIMTGATIGHNTKMDRCCHVASQAVLGAYLEIKKGVHIGVNSCTEANLTIGEYATLGMGSVLTKNIGDREIWVGNPAKFHRMAK